MAKIIVVGSTNADMILRLGAIPRPGETVLGGDFSMANGGKGANQAVSAARAGGKVTFIARVGEDAFGRQMLSDFAQEGIDTNWVSQDANAATGVALIFVDDQAENAIGVGSGANAGLLSEHIHAATAAFEGAEMLLLQLETPLPTVETAARLAAERGMTVILNPAPAQALPDSLLQHVKILTPNRLEAEALAGSPVQNLEDAQNAAQRIHERGVETVIITLGADGVAVSSGGGFSTLPAFNVDAVDTTAAGDVFNGALAVALSNRGDLDKAVRFASAAAALSVTRPGAQPSIPMKEEIEVFLRAHQP